MNRWVIVFVLACCVGATALALATETTTSSPDKQGTVTYVEGDLKRKPVEVETWASAPEKSPVVSGDKVRTMRQSRAELELTQSGLIRLAPKTIIDILKLEEESKTKASETAVALETGDIWANVDTVSADASFDIFTPVAAAAITGTVLRLSATADTATDFKVLDCWVYEGNIAVTPLKPDGEGLEDTTFSVQAGEQFTLVKEFEEYRRQQEKAFEEFKEGFEEFEKEQRKQYEKYRQEEEEAFQQFKSLHYVLKKFDIEKDQQLDWVRWNLKRDRQLK